MMMSKLMRTPERLLRVMMTETADSESGDTPGEHQDSGTLSAIRPEHASMMRRVWLALAQNDDVKAHENAREIVESHDDRNC